MLLRQSTLHTLEAYARVFAAQYAEPIELDELIDRMLQEFMATDRAFQKHRHAPAMEPAHHDG